MTQPVPVPPVPAPQNNTVLRFLIGCFAVFAALALVVGALVWWFLVRPAQRLFSGVASLAQLEDLDKGVRNPSNFSAPASGQLENAQLERFLSVQRGMKSRIGAEFGQISQKYKDDGQNQNPDLGKALEAYGDFFRIIVDAKKAQVDALNAQNFSLSEYGWVRGEVYRAALQEAGVPFAGFPSLSGGEPSLPPTSSEAVSANVEKVRPFRDELLENMPFHAFGL